MEGTPIELLLASLVRQILDSGDLDPDWSDPFQNACFEEWLEATDDWEKRVLAAAKAIGARPNAAPVWALLTCFVWAEDAKRKTFGSSHDVQMGYALDQLVFYLLEADERHRMDLENRQSKQPTGGPQSKEPYGVAQKVSVDKAARWVCGESDEEFDRAEIILREALRRFQKGTGVTFSKRTLLRAWEREQDEAAEGGDEMALVDGYENTERMKRVKEIWEAWRSTNDKGDPAYIKIPSEYAGLFELLSRR